MKKSIIAVSLVALLTLVPASPALATAPTTGYGQAVYVSTVDYVERTANGVTIMTYTDTYEVYGVIEGTYITKAVNVFRPDGRFAIRATAVCVDCTVEGRTGTVYFRASYHPMIGLFSVLRGTGELSNLRGQGSIDLTTLVITFNYHFD
jgi:hypothetical protein